MAGYTWFHVYQALDSSGSAVEVFNAGGAQIYPPLSVISPTNTTFFRQPAHAVRARTHEEISQEEQVKISTEELRVARKTLRWAIIAFAATVIFGLLDLVLRVFMR